MLGKNRNELHSQNEHQAESNLSSQAGTLTRSHNYSTMNPVFFWILSVVFTLSNLKFLLSKTEES